MRVPGWLRPHETDEEAPRLLARDALVWTAAWLLPLALLLAVIPASIPKRLTIPVLMIGLNLAATCLVGRIGLVATAPAFAYGWSAVAWMVAYKQAKLAGGASWVSLAAVASLLVVAAGIALMRGRLRRDAAVLSAGTVVLMAACRTVAAARKADEITGSLTRAVIALGILAVVLWAAWLLLRASLRAVARCGGRGAAARALARPGLVFAAGLLPVVLGGFLATAPAPLVLLATACGYVGLSLAAIIYLTDADGILGLLLLPLLVGATVALCAVAPVRLLPPYRPGETLLALCAGHPVAQALAAGAHPVVRGLSWLFGGPTRGALALVMQPKAFVRVTDELVQALCLHEGLLLLAALVRLVSARSRAQS